MIRDRLIVCIASRWDYDPTSKHHLMRILSRQNRILWVNYHGTRRPSATTWDLCDSIRAAGRIARGLQQISPSMHQLTPMVIPGSTGLLHRLHQRLLCDQIQWAIGQIDPGRNLPVQVWSFAPDVHFLGGRLGEECFVYYCVDEYTKFQGFDSSRLAMLESIILAKADVAIATSTPLWESKRKIRPDIRLVPHGVDYDHFASAWQGHLRPPLELAGVARPTFGFFGLVHHWFDVELVAEVARLRPRYAFVLIGDCKTDVVPLTGLPNVHLLGRKSYASLPSFCAAFQAGLLPFVRNEMTQCVNPIKLAEYLAAGLPVVATNIPAAAEFEGPVTIASTPQEFAAACDAALAYTDADRPRVSAAVRDQTWEARVETVSRFVLQSLRPVLLPTQPKLVNASMGGGYWKPLEGLCAHPAT